MSERELLRVVSHVPGRLRVRALRFRNPAAAPSALLEGLGALPGVARTTVTPVTGSLLVLYDPAVVGLSTLVAFLLAEGGFDGIEADLPAAGRRALTAERVIAAAQRANRLTMDLALPVDLRVAIPGVLAGVGLTMFAVRRKRSPEWYDFLWWSFSAFAALKAVPPRGDVARHDPALAASRSDEDADEPGFAGESS